MRCPYCNHEETAVIETRDGENSTRRRRECEKCKKRFTTYERVEDAGLVVIKKDGRREKFDREKLKRGIVRATEKRPISTELIDNIIDDIEQELRNRNTIETGGKTIGNLVLKKLKKIDKVSYVRFASVYLDFEDLEDFEKIIDKLT